MSVKSEPQNNGAGELDRHSHVTRARGALKRDSAEPIGSKPAITPINKKLKKSDLQEKSQQVESENGASNTEA